jgi:hypothetical protein
MKCSSCQVECAKLVECHPPFDAIKEYGQIGALHLCAVCEFVYRVKPSYVIARAAGHASAVPGPTRNVA